jgi:sporulation protein YlmC with PRC-barrel domain
MANLTDKELRGIPVYTKSGDRLGKIAGIVVDAERHEVREYSVSKSSLLSALLPGDLLINRSQVLELTSERMTVADAAVNERVAEAVLPKQASHAMESGAHSSRTAE